ncbi:hypothetical protein [Streptomyces sp. CC224B]|uniref:hypothetical protein n=1 Tax=Streptomyces sp. CC224B TaxID=3044571 RepID=UPI0024A9E72A|nr:hypothetical protein [Streptomyces sp. CC224B]
MTAHAVDDLQVVQYPQEYVGAACTRPDCRWRAPENATPEQVDEACKRHAADLGHVNFWRTATVFVSVDRAAP